MEAVIPSREFEEREDHLRSNSVPENLSSSSDDSDSDSDSYSGSYSRPLVNIPSRSISSRGLVRMIDHDDDAYARAEDEEDEGKVFPNQGKNSKPPKLWWGVPVGEDDSSYYSSSDGEYTDTELESGWNGMDDLEQGDYKLRPPPHLGLCCLNVLKIVVPEEKELAVAAFRKDAELALEEYKRQKGVDYEFVKPHGGRLTSPADPEDDYSRLGMHMNFWAKLEGLDSSPEFFFASLQDGEAHCCKLSYDATLEGILHCEHIQCSECDLWTVGKV